MDKEKIQQIVFNAIKTHCADNGIELAEELTEHTPLIGINRILDSLGLVNIIVDIETAFLDEGIEVSLTSETALSGRISPFRSVGSLCGFIARQIKVEE
jgi:acyl carrier protein